ncbi:hypothetical protein DMUE_6325, partial [Dictyocoela muelleri]
FDDDSGQLKDTIYEIHDKSSKSIKHALYSNEYDCNLNTSNPEFGSNASRSHCDYNYLKGNRLSDFANNKKPSQTSKFYPNNENCKFDYHNENPYQFENGIFFNNKLDNCHNNNIKLIESQNLFNGETKTPINVINQKNNSTQSKEKGTVICDKERFTNDLLTDYSDDKIPDINSDETLKKQRDSYNSSNTIKNSKHDYFTPESSNLRSNILPVVENSYYD